MPATLPPMWERAVPATLPLMWGAGHARDPQFSGLNIAALRIE